MYRTTPLRGLWQRRPYFHDGSAATLEDVVDHYDDVLWLGLTAAERKDLVAFLSSLEPACEVTCRSRRRGESAVVAQPGAVTR